MQDSSISKNIPKEALQDIISLLKESSYALGQWEAYEAKSQYDKNIEAILRNTDTITRSALLDINQRSHAVLNSVIGQSPNSMSAEEISDEAYLDGINSIMKGEPQIDKIRRNSAKIIADGFNLEEKYPVLNADVNDPFDRDNKIEHTENRQFSFA